MSHLASINYHHVFYDLILGEMGPMVASTLKLGIAVLNGGNSTVQQVPVPNLVPRCSNFTMESLEWGVSHVPMLARERGRDFQACLSREREGLPIERYPFQLRVHVWDCQIKKLVLPVLVVFRVLVILLSFR